jgi:hypothetical protein
MHVTNIPHADNKRAQLTPSVEHDHAKVRVIDPQIAPPYNSSGVCDLYIGAHMFTPENHDALRMMVARALVVAIEHGRGAGYAQAQADMRAMLGLGK